MKRGKPLRRKTRLQARKPMPRGEGLARGNGLSRTGGPIKNRKALPPVNKKRLAKRRAEQFGDQAQLCRESSCCACGAPPPSDPAHVLSRGAGGKDGDTVPLCRRCHDLQHSQGIKTFQAERGLDLKAVASDLAAKIRDQSPPER